MESEIESASTAMIQISRSFGVALNTDSTDPIKNPPTSGVPLEHSHFLRRMQRLVSESVNPLETLANLIYLTKADPQNARVTAEYMSLAEKEIIQMATILNTLRSYIENAT